MGLGFERIVARLRNEMLGMEVIVARSDSTARWRQFEQRILAIAELRGFEVRAIRGSPERSVVEIDGRPYIILVPGTGIPITQGNVQRRLRAWPKLKGRTPSGYIILASRADLSPTLAESGEFASSQKAAVLALWGTQNRLASSKIDDEMALLLEAAGAAEADVLRALQRSQAVPSRHFVTTAGPAIGEVTVATRLLRPGHLIDAYRLERRLGRGHSAEVWKATVVAPIAGVGLQHGTTVALKLYLPALLQGFDSLRIQREFTVAAELQHPHLARVFDLVLSPSRPHHAFLAMEYIDGPTLKAFIEQHGPMPATDVVRVGEQLFSALEEIHTQGALHRDVKAANILIASSTRPALTIKLVDLGIVSVPTDDRLTQASVFLGSKHSAPLEQLRGQILDERTDIYGAGSVLYHALTGRPMYDGAGPEGAIVVQMIERPQRLPAAQEDHSLDGRLRRFVNSCIAIKPKERPPSAAECLNMLRELRQRASPGSTT